MSGYIPHGERTPMTITTTLQPKYFLRMTIIALVCLALGAEDVGGHLYVGVVALRQMRGLYTSKMLRNLYIYMVSIMLLVGMIQLSRSKTLIILYYIIWIRKEMK